MNGDIIQKNIEDGIYKSKLPYKSRKENLEMHMAYITDEGKLQAKFNNDLFNSDEFKGIEPSKFHIVFGKAWEIGHSAGLYQVAYDFFDLCDFIKEMQR